MNTSGVSGVVSGTSVLTDDKRALMIKNSKQVPTFGGTSTGLSGVINSATMKTYQLSGSSIMKPGLKKASKLQDII
jgi:hypothetical protein